MDIRDMFVDIRDMFVDRQIDMVIAILCFSIGGKVITR